MQSSPLHPRHAILAVAILAVAILAIATLTIQPLPPYRRLHSSRYTSTIYTSTVAAETTWHLSNTAAAYYSLQSADSHALCHNPFWARIHRTAYTSISSHLAMQICSSAPVVR